jgi:hypothetical protein
MASVWERIGSAASGDQENYHMVHERMHITYSFFNNFMRMKNLLIFFEIFAAWMRIPDNQDLINIL